LNKRQLAALAVDDPEIGDDAGQQLRLAGVDQFFNRAFGKTAHLQRHFVKQVA
jgi:small basic protein